MSHRPAPASLARLIGLGTLSLALAACVVNVPGGGKLDDVGLAKKPGTAPNVAAAASAAPSPAATATAAPAPSAAPSTALVAAATPEPLPSLGLLIAGKVAVDTSLMLQAGLAERTASGARLISNNGPGLISDKGVGLIANNSGSLTTPGGSGTLIANNSGNLTAKTKFVLAQAGAPAGGFSPVQGMLVKAISLRTGEVLAGPVATDAEGGFRLGFLARPETNLQIVAYVNNREQEDAFNYVSLTPAADSAPIVASDDTDVVARYMLQVLAGRVQGGIDARKRGESDQLDENVKDETERRVARALNAALAGVSPADAVKVDDNGRTARTFAQRVVSFVDLSLPVVGEIRAIVEDLRKFDQTLSPRPAVSVPDEVVKLCEVVRTLKDIVPALEAHGMPHEQAQAIYDRLMATGEGLNTEMSRIGLAHYDETLGYVFSIPELAGADQILVSELLKK